jgi:ubiquitin thioesterase protein OTUB1
MSPFATMLSVATHRSRASDQQDCDAMPLSNTLISPPSLYSPFFPRYSTFDGNDHSAETDSTYSSPSYVDFAANHDPRFPTMEPLSREELERFQKLSNEYEPELQVG